MWDFVMKKHTVVEHVRETIFLGAAELPPKQGNMETLRLTLPPIAASGVWQFAACLFQLAPDCFCMVSKVSSCASVTCTICSHTSGRYGLRVYF